ncbi:hypothetical protein [Bacillus safensis]|uniref:hypothetical protein n=1 Tax=Bacillus safensis TaxID=561879 RepID=UPI001CF6C110|nr:hypothetical protein [Bacillus safensis]
MISASKEETAHLSIIPFIFVLLGLFMITIAVNLQVPLYTAYAEQAGYGKAATALVFAAYASDLFQFCFFLAAFLTELDANRFYWLRLAFRYVPPC